MEQPVLETFISRPSTYEFLNSNIPETDIQLHYLECYN